MTRSSMEGPGAEGRPVARVAVLGLGLMGGSLALAARRVAEVETVRGFDVDESAVAYALSEEMITEAAATPQEAVAGVDIAVICAPIRAIPGLIEQCIYAPRPPAAITDIGSTKGAIATQLPREARSRYVGGHPICGAETRGIRYARMDLYRTATYFLCPSTETRDDVERMVRSFVTSIGARPVLLDAAAHDRIMALTSHVPHVIANILMTRVGSFESGGRRALHSVGPSFKDLTRVAGANPPLWKDISFENREALIASLSNLADDIIAFCSALRRGDETEVLTDIQSAARFRQELLQYEDISPETLYRVTVRIPDEPGVLSRVMTALGDAEINIEDLTLHHFNRRTGGDLLLYVSGEDTAYTTQELLTSLGYPTMVSFGGGSDMRGLDA